MAVAAPRQDSQVLALVQQSAPLRSLQGPHVLKTMTISWSCYERQLELVQVQLFQVDAVFYAGQRVLLEETFAVEQYLHHLVDAVFHAGQRV